MSKPIKNMIVAEYKRRFDGVDSALIIDIRGIDANENNNLRVDLLDKNIHITVLKNSLAKTAFEGTELESLCTSLSGPNALVCGGDSVVDVARTLVDWAKKIKQLELKAAVLDGELFEGADGVKRLSDYPTKEEAQAKVVQLVLSPAGNLVKAATSPGSNVLGIIKEIKTRLEEGNTIEKIS
ncbi:MAG: 50S ribosomal protein L10 [Phycisphaerae bacterium]|jgi:large subunit ribosomal protein L10|nr:50S ribosomal protein L10 [Phycisphaerae bacterium]MBT5365529.1 50S ribosomal protein L10 [Phycisphaerae bacterium]MBT6270361.1 50S ribosomal protein L10 [Phycisphaerae bacterium]MBT6283137.1 50S ribosomal protein L10 [Phycisphaerae bacterium]